MFPLIVYLFGLSLIAFVLSISGHGELSMAIVLFIVLLVVSPFIISIIKYRKVGIKKVSIEKDTRPLFTLDNGSVVSVYFIHSIAGTMVLDVNDPPNTIITKLSSGAEIFSKPFFIKAIEDDKNGYNEYLIDPEYFLSKLGSITDVYKNLKFIQRT